jgi:hypothetical protein
LEENRLAVNYWIFKVKDEVGGLFGRRAFAIFDHRANERFWALRELNEKGKLEAHLKELKEGDKVIFFLVEKGKSRFVGTCVLDSGFLTLDEEKEKEILHSDFIDWNQGVFLGKVDKWDKPLPAECLRDNPSFVHSGGNLGAFFQGSIKKIKRSEDFGAIIREHKLFVRRSI